MNKKSLYIPGAIVIAGILIAGAVAFSPSGATRAGSGNPAGAALQPTDDTGQGSPGAGARVDIEILDTDPTLGNPDASVVFVEFGDFECPFCRRFTQDTKPLLEKDYIESGDVLFVWKDFPLSIHARAETAHEAARCAQEQGKFWEYHDLLYANQQALHVNNLKSYAGDLGLNQDQFDSCLDSEKYRELIGDGLNLGSRSGVSGTPSFLINGRLVVGALPYSSFSDVIEEALDN